MDLRTYNDSPEDPIAALQDSNALAQAGQHDSALLLAESGLLMSPDADTRASLLERISISGFYSKLGRRKAAGKNACEDLSTDRTRSWHTKNLARQNSTYYANGAIDLMPGTTFTEVGFVPPYDYRPMNPSITSHGGRLWMIQRTVNYMIRPDGSYDMRGDSAIRTANYLIRLNDDLSVAEATEILPPADLPEPLYNLVIGWEDCRLFFWKGEPWCTSTVRELNVEGYCEIVLSRIVDDASGNKRFADYRVIRPSFTERQHEKNWMPMVVGDDLFFVYSSDPTRIIDHGGNLISSRVAHIAADSFRGGGPLVQLDGGWLALIHESHGMPDHRRRYMHRFVWYDPYGRLAKHTQAFYIKDLGIEFAAGLAMHPSTGRIIASFGVHDRSSWLASFDTNEIKRLLNPSGEPLHRLPTDPAEMVWITGQTNRPLADHATVSRCIDMTRKAALPTHTDAPKNWDNLLAVWHATLTTDLTSPVMDVAATPESAFLPSLRKMGYRNLISINLTQEQTEVIDGVAYQHGDCTKTNFLDGYFGFIACLSVVEHGVDLDSFFRESSRILMQGGHLLVSTDYWQDQIDTRGQMAFGSPVKVFDSSDIIQMIQLAKLHGLEITGPIDLECKDRVVNWIGMDYTFMNLLFRKP